MNHKQCTISALQLLVISPYQPQTQGKEISVTEIQTEQLINEIDVHDLQIVVMDKCEYIFYKKSPSTNRGSGFTGHKRNCKNTIHYYSRNKKDHD